MPPSNVHLPSHTGRSLAVAWGCLAACVLLLAGCAGYRFGPTQGRRAGEKSVQILPFHNETVEPRLTDTLGHALRKTLQQDATFRLETRGEPEIRVSGTITTFQRSFLSLDPRDVATPRDYDLAAVVKLRAVEVATDKVLLDREISGRTTVRVRSDTASAERQSVPILAEILARKAVSLLADGDW